MIRAALILLIALNVIATSACTRIPAEYRQVSTLSGSSASATSKSSSNSELLNLIGNSRIGASQTHVDDATGLASMIRVTSEYFSANGRSCRRFEQHFSNAAAPENKLACKARHGWQEIPVASIVE